MLRFWTIYAFILDRGGGGVETEQLNKKCVKLRDKEINNELFIFFLNTMN